MYLANTMIQMNQTIKRVFLGDYSVSRKMQKAIKLRQVCRMLLQCAYTILFSHVREICTAEAFKMAALPQAMPIKELLCRRTCLQ